METLTTSDALDKLARQIKSLDARAEVYVLPSDPYYGASADNDVHVAVIADTDDAGMDALSEPLASLVEAINVELEYDPFVVAHPTNQNATLARRAREDGVRL
jgi:hypothetical protein